MCDHDCSVKVMLIVVVVETLMWLRNRSSEGDRMVVEMEGGGCSYGIGSRGIVVEMDGGCSSGGWWYGVSWVVLVWWWNGGGSKG